MPPQDVSILSNIFLGDLFVSNVPSSVYLFCVPPPDSADKVTSSSQAFAAAIKDASSISSAMQDRPYLVSV